MRRIFILLLVTGLFPLQSFAQTDWANTNRYAAENAALTQNPKVVFIGDSITQCWLDADPSFFSDNNFLCRGISGQTTSHMLCRFRSDVVDLAPEYVAILGGTNDIARNIGYISLENICANIKSMCEIAVFNNIKPIVCSVLPSKGYDWRPDLTDVGDQIIKLNGMLKEYAQEKQFVFVDYHSVMVDDEKGLPKSLSYDGCHATAAGYEIMEQVILQVL